MKYSDSVLLDNRFIEFVNSELLEVNKQLPSAFKFKKNKYSKTNVADGPGNKEWKSSPIIKEWAERDAVLIGRKCKLDEI